MALSFTPTIFKTSFFTPTAAGDLTIWTPTSGKRFRLLRYFIEIPYSNYTSISGGNLFTGIIKDGTSLVNGLTETAWIPPSGAPGPIPIGAYVVDRDLGNGYLSTAADNVLYLNVNMALNLTNCGLRVSVYGTEE